MYGKLTDYRIKIKEGGPVFSDPPKILTVLSYS